MFSITMEMVKLDSRSDMYMYQVIVNLKNILFFFETNIEFKPKMRPNISKNCRVTVLDKHTQILSSRKFFWKFFKTVKY